MLGLFVNAVIIAQTDSALNHEGSDVKSKSDVAEYKGTCGCSNPMSSEDFTIAINDIRLKITDNKMLARAKQNIRGNCLLANQVEEIMLVSAGGITRLISWNLPGTIHTALTITTPYYESTLIFTGRAWNSGNYTTLLK